MTLTLTLWPAVLGIVAIMGVGGALPLWCPREGRALQCTLAAAAGVMLGTALTHLMPDAFVRLGASAGYFVLAGFVFLYLFERFVTVHICEAHDCRVHTVGLSALFGLSIHTFANGVALGSGLEQGMGGIVFFALAAHKLPEAFSLTAILLHENYRRSRILLMNVLFMSMIPLGALCVRLLATQAGVFDHGWPIGAWGLAFSAGTFIHVAVSDLLPEVHRRGTHREVMAVAFCTGILLVVLVGGLLGE